MAEYIVLSDDLFVCYQTFHRQANPKRQLKKKYKRLLANYSAHKTNMDQVNRCKVHFTDVEYKEFQTNLLAGSIPNQSLEHLAQETVFKIVLTEDEQQTEPPYLNIKKGGVLSKDYTITYSPKQERRKLVDYISSLCEKASKVIICDKYFVKNWANETENLFKYIIPKKKLDIYYVDAAPTSISTKANEIKAKCNDWTVDEYKGKDYITEDNHDRYLVIEASGKKIQIMLSSGFSYLWDNKKEITCVFREIAD